MQRELDQYINLNRQVLDRERVSLRDLDACFACVVLEDKGKDEAMKEISRSYPGDNISFGQEVLQRGGTGSWIMNSFSDGERTVHVVMGFRTDRLRVAAVSYKSEKLSTPILLTHSTRLGTFLNGEKFDKKLNLPAFCFESAPILNKAPSLFGVQGGRGN